MESPSCARTSPTRPAVVACACSPAAAVAPSTGENPNHAPAAAADLHRSCAGHRRHPDLQDQRLGQPQGRQPLRAVPTTTTRPRSSSASDDVNLAYAAANTIVDPRLSRGESRMVQKVAGGHNCWLGSNDACADILTTWIENWAGATAGGSDKIVARGPADQGSGLEPQLPGTTPRRFRERPSTRCVEEYCAGCHSSTAATPQSPFFASSDVEHAYAAAQDQDQPRQPAQLAAGGAPAR